MSKSKEELQQEKEAKEKKLVQYQHKQNRIDQRIRYLTDGEQKKRTHRLITRGAAVECVAPEVKDMGEVAFYNLVEEVFSLPKVRQLVQSATKPEGD